MDKSPAAAKRPIPQKSLVRAVICVTLGALLAGVAGGYAIYRLDPQGRSVIARWLQQQAPAVAQATSTPAAGATPGAEPTSTTTMLQQFNAAITSYQAQPMDARTGLRLIIPRLHINAPIVERGLVGGWMVVAPGDAVTHFIYSAYPGAAGNAILYSHAGTVFRHLDSIAVGDTILVQTPQGSAQFRVRELRIVAPTDLSVLDTTQRATLTLLTCYPFMVDSSRLVVIADLVGP